MWCIGAVNGEQIGEDRELLCHRINHTYTNINILIAVCVDCRDEEL